MGQTESQAERDTPWLDETQHLFDESEAKAKQEEREKKTEWTFNHLGKIVNEPELKEEDGGEINDFWACEGQTQLSYDDPYFVPRRDRNFPHDDWVIDNSFREESAPLKYRHLGDSHQPFQKRRKTDKVMETKVSKATEYFKKCKECRNEQKDLCDYSCEIKAPIALKSTKNGKWYRNQRDPTPLLGWEERTDPEGEKYWYNKPQKKSQRMKPSSTKFKLMPTGGSEVYKMQVPCKLSDREILELENTPYSKYSVRQKEKDIELLENLKTEFETHRCCISGDDDNVDHDCEKILKFIQKKIDAIKKVKKPRYSNFSNPRHVGYRPDYSSSPRVERQKRRSPEWYHNWWKERVSHDLTKLPGVGISSGRTDSGEKVLGPLIEKVTSYL